MRTENDIKKLRGRPCSDCGGAVQRKAVTQEFEREGIKITISDFDAWACINCGEIYFEPGSADKLVEEANRLFALEKQRRSKGCPQES